MDVAIGFWIWVVWAWSKGGGGGGGIEDEAKDGRRYDGDTRETRYAIRVSD